MLIVAAWWDTLLGRSQTPLKAVADEETVEVILSKLDKLQGQMTNLQFEWADTLDKLTRLANRAAARQKKRAQRDFDDEVEDDPPPPPRQPTETHLAPPNGFVDVKQLDKAQLRAYLRSRMG